MEARDYQEGALARVSQTFREVKRVLLAAPTGSGKTIVGSLAMKRTVARGKRCLFVAHRRELIKQTYTKLVECGVPHEQIGIIMAGDGALAEALGTDVVRRANAPIQVASIDTFRARYIAVPSRPKPQFDLVIVDECHRAMARSYTDLQGIYAGSFHLGLTATPYRADGKGLDGAYDRIVVVASPAELIERGFLVEPRIFTTPMRPELKKVGVRNGDYKPEELSAVMDVSPLVGDIVRHWQDRAEGRRTVVFASSVEHSEHIRDQFLAAGVRAAHIDGETPTDERDASLAAIDHGDLQVLTNYGICQEGWDSPPVKCLILARPTKSEGLYLQQAGRVLRPWEGIQPIILDHAGCVHEHGLPQETREFTLEGKEKQAATTRSPSVKTCEECFCVLPAGTKVCPECGASLVKERAEVEVADGELVEVSAAGLAEQNRYCQELVEIALERNYKSGWVYHQFKTKFGTWPPTRWLSRLFQSQGPDEKKAFYNSLIVQQQSKGYKFGWVVFRYQSRYGVVPSRDAGLR